MLAVQLKYAYAARPKTERTLEIMFHIARYLAGGLNIVMTIPAANNPIAVKTSETVPVIRLAVDGVNRK